MPYVSIVDETTFNLMGDFHQMTQYDITTPNMKQQQQQQQQVNYNRYKTELCRQFSENGECKYGDKCQFAHGSHELKDVKRHPRYKTDLCKTFHSKGFCPYGPRCHFIHEINEKRDQTSAKKHQSSDLAPQSPLKRAIVKPTIELNVHQLVNNLTQLTMSDEFAYSSCGSSNASSGSVSPTSSSFSQSSSPYYAFSLSSAFSSDSSSSSSSISVSSSTSTSSRSTSLVNTLVNSPPPLNNNSSIKHQLSDNSAAQFSFNRNFHNDFLMPLGVYDSWSGASECDWPITNVTSITSTELSAAINANSQSALSTAYQFNETKIR